jgi:hypothetical protein
MGQVKAHAFDYVNRTRAQLMEIEGAMLDAQGLVTNASRCFGVGGAQSDVGEAAIAVFMDFQTVYFPRLYQALEQCDEEIQRR